MRTNIVAIDRDARLNLFGVLIREDGTCLVTWERSNKWKKYFTCTRQECFELVDNFLIIDSFV